MSASHHHPDPATLKPKVQEVSDGLFAYIQPDGTWWINNAAFLVGRRGVVSIDACSTAARTRAYREAIAATTSLPVRTLINTHHHGDHTFGNCLFPEATVVGHERTRAEILASGWPPPDRIWTGVDWGDIELEPPFLTYTDEVVIYVDDLRCVVRHVGQAAHTSNDSVVWVPDRGVLFTGDVVFNGGTPFVLMGSVTGAIEVLEQVKAYGAQTIVPGHGEVCGPEALDAVQGYLRFVLDLARKGQSAGVAPLEAARETDLGRWASLTDSERLVGNLHRAYADLEGGSLSPEQLMAALNDMVEYNGGQPLTCYA
jgi:cyclase